MATRRPSGDQETLLANKQARFHFELLETFEAGIVLIGCEVKSLREGLCNWSDAYCRIRDGELWLEGLHIKAYPNASIFRPAPDRMRKLLMRKREIERLYKKAVQAGLTLVPTRIYTSGRYIKVEVAIARGKKLHDKRQDLKRRDAERAMARGRD